MPFVANSVEFQFLSMSSKKIIKVKETDSPLVSLFQNPPSFKGLHGMTSFGSKTLSPLIFWKEGFG